nr:hypothetical protein [Lachnospiraceae bacterium]
KEPGKYYTADKWTDPFELMYVEELKGKCEKNVAAILSQSAVESVYSGGALVSEEKSKDVIEGVKGKGDDFMIGNLSKNKLPRNLQEQIIQLAEELRQYHNLIGDVSIEWVFDGKDLWIVQLNQIEEVGNSSTIVEGKANSYRKFFVEEGLEKLRDLIEEIKDKNIGIELIGDVGICSHFGDVIRQAKIPSFINKTINETVNNFV